MASINIMLKKISGLVGTSDITEWEDEFITNMNERAQDGKDTRQLSEKQVSTIEKIHDKHFA
jgi:hypothetical protein